MWFQFIFVEELIWNAENFRMRSIILDQLCDVQWIVLSSGGITHVETATA